MQKVVYPCLHPFARAWRARSRVQSPGCRCSVRVLCRGFDKWVEGLFAGREGHEGFNPRDINDQKLMRAINKRTTSMDVDSAGRIGLSESLRKQANLDREVTVVGNYDHLEVWDRAAADEDDDDEALLDLFFS